MRLIYFDFPGRAQAIRDALRMGGVAFEDVRVDHGWFRVQKDGGHLPFDTLPVLELRDGTIICQSNTILRYAAELAGLTPESVAERLMVDAHLDAAEDFFGRVSVSIRAGEGVLRDQLREELATRWLPEYFQLLERSLSRQPAGFLVGEGLTAADLKVVHWLDKVSNGSLAGISPDCLAPYRAVVAWRERVHGVRHTRLG